MLSDSLCSIAKRIPIFKVYLFSVMIFSVTSCRADQLKTITNNEFLIINNREERFLKLRTANSQLS